jgi:proteic killer suppression protein
MIKSFRHKGIQRFYESGKAAGINSNHKTRLIAQLAKLNSSVSPDDMNLPNWRLHPLAGNLKDHWSVWVDHHWRLTFRFDGEDAELVDYQDYH